MTTLFETLLSAIAAGAVYGLLGVGFSLTYKTTGIINFAHGNFAILGAFVAYALIDMGTPLVIAMLGGIAAAGIAAGVMERAILRPLYGRPLIAGILVTVGVAVVIESSTQLIAGSVPRTLPSLASTDAWQIGSLSFSPSQLTILLVALAVSVAIVLYVSRTRTGRAMRGCAQDSEAVSLLGVSPQRLYFAAFVLAGLLAGIAGVLIAPSIGLVPSRGLSLTVLAFAAAVLGGLGSLPGAVLGGIVIAVLQNLAAVYVTTDYAAAVGYLAIILVLLVRVRGLLGDELETLRQV